MKRKRTIFTIGITAFFILSLAGCDSIKEQYDKMMKKQKGNPAAQSEIAETIFAVNTTTAVEGQIHDYIDLNGDVITKGNVDIFADNTGKVTALSIEIGDKIEKDQIIAEVDPSRPGMKFVASPVKSPISGTIVSIPVQIGSTVAISMPIATVSRTEELQIQTEVAERFISKMRVGLLAIIRFEAYPDERFYARITEISPVVDPQSRTLGIKLSLTRADKRIKTGMFAKIKIITEKKNDIVKIPAQCLIKRYGVYYVFVVHDESGNPEGAWVEKREVNPGIEIDNKLEITDGLKPDEIIVIRGQTLLEDKAKVRVIDQIQPLETEDIIQ
jgi:multidrug efflux pump subunit AcrA (membrane-fusion protein)